MSLKFLEVLEPFIKGLKIKPFIRSCYLEEYAE